MVPNLQHTVTAPRPGPQVLYQTGVAPLPTALIQLCDCRRAYLLHVSQFKRPAPPKPPPPPGVPVVRGPAAVLPPGLVALLRSPAAIKVGVNLGGDLAKLHWDFVGLQARGHAPPFRTLSLCPMVRQCKSDDRAVAAGPTGGGRRARGHGRPAGGRVPRAF